MSEERSFPRGLNQVSEIEAARPQAESFSSILQRRLTRRGVLGNGALLGAAAVMPVHTCSGEDPVLGARAADALVRDQFLLPEAGERLKATSAALAALPPAATAAAPARQTGESLCR